MAPIAIELIDEQHQLLLDYLLLNEKKILGSGRYGTVYQADNTTTLPWLIKQERTLVQSESMCALKTTQDESIYPETSSFENEQRIFSRIYGPMSAYLIEERGNRYIPRHLGMIQIPGVPLNDSNLDIRTAENFVNAILAILYSIKNLHEMGVIHGDLNLNNLLLNEEDEGSYAAYPIDFGASRLVGELTLGQIGEGMPPELAQSIPAAPGQDAYMLNELFESFYLYLDEMILNDDVGNTPLFHFIKEQCEISQYLLCEHQLSLDQMINLWENYAKYNGYSLCANSPETLIEKYKLYIDFTMDSLSYVSSHQDTIYRGLISYKDLSPNLVASPPSSLEELEPYLANILRITTQRGHTDVTPMEIKAIKNPLNLLRQKIQQEMIRIRQEKIIQDAKEKLNLACTRCQIEIPLSPILEQLQALQSKVASTTSEIGLQYVLAELLFIIKEGTILKNPNARANNAPFWPRVPESPDIKLHNLLLSLKEILPSWLHSQIEGMMSIECPTPAAASEINLKQTLI